MKNLKFYLPLFFALLLLSCKTNGSSSKSERFVAGLPVNITFYGKAWSEPNLISMAYTFEQGTKHRKQPTFKTGE